MSHKALVAYSLFAGLAVCTTLLHGSHEAFETRGTGQTTRRDWLLWRGRDAGQQSAQCRVLARSCPCARWYFWRPAAEPVCDVSDPKET